MGIAIVANVTQYTVILYKKHFYKKHDAEIKN